MINRSVLKASLFEWSYWIESDGVCLVELTFIAIDVVTYSHWESVDKINFLLHKLWCKQVELNNEIIRYKHHYLNNPMELKRWRASCRLRVYLHWYRDGLASRDRRKTWLTPLVKVLSYSLFGWKPGNYWIQITF